MIKTQPAEVPVHVDPYSFVTDIRVLSGNNVQNFNKDTNKYESDRALVPCVLMPYVSVFDPEEVMDGEQPITGAEWYEGAPKADGSNRISNNDFYVISGPGKPAFSLTVKKNIDYNVPIELHCIYSITDKRRNTQDKFERSISFRTTLFDSNNYSVKLTTPKTWTINPLEVVPDANGDWSRTIEAQLYSGANAVPDASSAWWWQIMDKGCGDRDFRDITADELEVAISGKDAAGNWGRRLTFDARMFRNVVFRARAAYYKDGVRPTAPTSDELQAITSVKIAMPSTLKINQKQTKGFRLNSKMNTPVAFELELSYNGKIIGPDKDEFFVINWFCRSLKPGFTPINIGKGRTTEFVPSTLNLESAYGVEVYASVALYAVSAIVSTTDGTIFAQGDSAITDDSGKLIIIQKYE